MTTTLTRSRITLCLTPLLAATLTCGAVAAPVFSYDPSGGQLPSDQGWQAHEVDTVGPLTSAGTAGLAADNANTAIEEVDGMNVLHIRDTLTDGDSNLPGFYYEWTSAQQQQLIDSGFHLSVIVQALTFTGSNGIVRLGLNNTEFELQIPSIGADQALSPSTLGSLLPLDGQFHDVSIYGRPNGGDYDFSIAIDGATPQALSVTSNPSPAAFESAVFVGALSSNGRNSDILVKSITMQTIPEPSAALLSMATLTCLAGVQRRRTGAR